jgi:hypothetical protein
MTIEWIPTLPSARERAAAEHRPLLVDFFSRTCLGCAQMDAVTYPDPAVAHRLATSFVPLRLDVAALVPGDRELLRMARPLFTPMLLFLDWSGSELRRFTGYLPPAEFLAELELVLGFSDLLHARHGEAYTRFRETARRHAGRPAAPEALYWAGVAAYRLQGQGLNGLIPEWAELVDRYGGTTWCERASCIADRLTVGGREVEVA